MSEFERLMNVTLEQLENSKGTTEILDIDPDDFPETDFDEDFSL